MYKDGEYERWYMNGQPMLQSVYKDGKLDGEYKRWHENGQLWDQCVYKNGKLEGEYKTWYENGQLRVQCVYKNGERDGEYNRWDKTGQLDTHVWYRHGEIVDLSTEEYAEAARKIWFDAWIPHWYSPHKQKPGFVRNMRELENLL